MTRRLRTSLAAALLATGLSLGVPAVAHADTTAPDPGQDAKTASSSPAALSLLGVWVAGGGILLTGGAIAVATSVRRDRRRATDS